MTTPHARVGKLRVDATGTYFDEPRGLAWYLADYRYRADGTLELVTLGDSSAIVRRFSHRSHGSPWESPSTRGLDRPDRQYEFNPEEPRALVSDALQRQFNAAVIADALPPAPRKRVL